MCANGLGKAQWTGLFVNRGKRTIVSQLRDEIEDVTLSRSVTCEIMNRVHVCLDVPAGLAAMYAARAR